MDCTPQYTLFSISMEYYKQGWHNDFEGGGTSSRAVRVKTIFDPHLWLTVFITAIMMYKRLCLPAPNDYNSGLCDYSETETVKECHF